MHNFRLLMAFDVKPILIAQSSGNTVLQKLDVFGIAGLSDSYIFDI